VTIANEASDIRDEYSLVDDLGLDSIGLLQVIGALELAFGLSIDDEALLDQADWGHNVATLIRFVEAQVQAT
jgi:acyl carrier protein